MRISLLIATDDIEYAEHLSNGVSERYSDVIDVSVCWTPQRLQELLDAQKFDVALLESSMIEVADLQSIHLPMILWDDSENAVDMPNEFRRIRKYQRISSIVANVLECYSKVSKNSRIASLEKASVTAVWSPAGGVGKSTVALAYAAKKQTEGKQVLYLNLELFSSVPAYFAGSGKSISTVFEMLENDEGNLEMLIRSIQQYDSCSGISYFCCPGSFDDMNILSANNITMLLNACSQVTAELVIDLPCVCDERTRVIFEFADKVLLVVDQTAAAQTKLDQFSSQHNVFESIRDKAVIVANRAAVINNPHTATVVVLPIVQSADQSIVYKTLSAGFAQQEN